MKTSHEKVVGKVMGKAEFTQEATTGVGSSAGETNHVPTPLKGGVKGSARHIDFRRAGKQCDGTGVLSEKQSLLSIIDKQKAMVRDFAASLGKEVNFVFSVDGAEVDGPVADVLTETLISLLRNSIEHGIEGPEERAAAGKARVGKVRVDGVSEGDRVSLTVLDDGRGIDWDRVASGDGDEVAEADTAAREWKAKEMLFSPGFSLCDDKEVSQRYGSGLNIVKRNMDYFGGTVDVDSICGKFTRFSINFHTPPTEFDGLVITVGNDFYVIPSKNVLELRRPSFTDISNGPANGEVVRFRDGFVPVVRLNRLFGTGEDVPSPWLAPVVFIKTGERVYGLLVDGFLGERHLGIRSFGCPHSILGIDSVALLENGMNVLVVDVEELVR